MLLLSFYYCGAETGLILYKVPSSIDRTYRYPSGTVFMSVMPPNPVKLWTISIEDTSKHTKRDIRNEVPL